MCPPVLPHSNQVTYPLRTEYPNNSVLTLPRVRTDSVGALFLLVHLHSSISQSCWLYHQFIYRKQPLLTTSALVHASPVFCVKCELFSTL